MKHESRFCFVSAKAIFDNPFGPLRLPISWSDRRRVDGGHDGSQVIARIMSGNKTKSQNFPVELVMNEPDEAIKAKLQVAFADATAFVLHNVAGLSRDNILGRLQFSKILGGARWAAAPKTAMSRERGPPRIQTGGLRGRQLPN